MNELSNNAQLRPTTVTTGPHSASRKIYSSPEGHPTCPFRSAKSPCRRPGLSSASTIRPAPTPTPTRSSTSPPACPASATPGSQRAANMEAYEGRTVKYEDNNAAGARLAPDFPQTRARLCAAFLARR